MGSGRTNSNGEFSITWKTSAGLVETDFDVYAVFDGNSAYDRARSYNQETSVLKHGGSITLNSFPNSANIGDVVQFSGKLNLDQHSSEGAIVYIKDEDALNPDDLLATGYVDRSGRFSADWIVRDVDRDDVADIYAVFEGSSVFYRLTTCDSGATKSFGGLCSKTIPLRIYDSQPIPPAPYVPTTGEYMEMFYSLNLYQSPKVAIVPSPDSYNTVKRHIVPVQEGIRMWESQLTNQFGGSWNVNFEVVKPGQDFFATNPDIIVNLVTHDDYSECVDELLGMAIINSNPTKPIQTVVCSTSLGDIRSNVDVSATSSHEFIHAVGLGHAFNKAGDLMCSIEDGKPTCANLNSKSKTPSILNLEAVKKIYGSDGFQNPNNRISYESRFALDNIQNNEITKLTVVQDNKCPRTDYSYDSTVDDLNIKSGYYVYWILCTDTISYSFSTGNEHDGFKIYLLPPQTDVGNFINNAEGKYYICEEYGKDWITKSNTCNIAPGSTLVLHNENQNAIVVNGYIRN